MITWILGGILIVWILFNRFSQDGKVKGEPLGMPRGTVRALITIMIVSFPLGYLITQETIPSLIVNAIFIVVAFYFEARRSSHEKLKQIVNEVKNSEHVSINLMDAKKPLYLPKYTVRFSLVVILVLIQVMIVIQPSIIFETTNSLADILLIVGFFIIGAFFRSVASSREKKKIKTQIENMDASLSDVDIIEKLMLNEQSWWRRKGKNVLSVAMLAAIITGLLFYTFDIDTMVFSSKYYTLTLQGMLLLFVNVYYGFRD
ncbi:hypothetical protein LCGC14_0649870 [marine sediment metagenome]|uniref:Uncharacterized protein n=1 Tax=marine sediment metagenome TaxID=412755 RepID=A0A0F9U509_9ZZZZ|nr:MAG: hypothetical protein Lokiarch_08250 [Candidatus Lokiarchaeum sp. GC14_75]